MKTKFGKLTLRSISLILSVAICLVSLPMAAFAIETEGEISAAQSSELLKDIVEIVGLREENVKHFKMEDGTYTAVQYDVPIHYLDEYGVWRDIDNTLTDCGSEYSSNDAPRT